MSILIRNFILKTLTIFYVIISIQSIGQVDIDWEKSYNFSFDEPKHLLNTDDGGFIVLGNKANPTYYDIWLIKTDSFGNLEWEKNFGGDFHDLAGNIIETNDNGYLLGGRTYSDNGNVTNQYGNGDIWLVKIDSLGNIEWEKNYGGSGAEFFGSVKQTNNGDFIIVSTTKSIDYNVSFIHNSTGSAFPNEDIWVFRINSTGSILWEKSYGGDLNDSGNDIIETSTGFLVLGNTNSTNGDVLANHGSYDILLLRINTVGNLEMSKTFGGSSIDLSKKIIDNNLNSNYLIAGSTMSNNGDVSTTTYNSKNEFWVLEVSSNGIISSSRNYGDSLYTNALYSLKQRDNGNLILGGEFEGANNGANTPTDCLIREIDYFSGDIIWEETYGGSGQERIIDLNIDNKDQITLLSFSNSNDGDITNHIFGYDFWLAKLIKPLGNIFGKIVLDFNNNCLTEVSDTLLDNTIIVANEINLIEDNFYSSTNLKGNYLLFSDFNIYNVSVIFPSPYLEPSNCSQSTQELYIDDLDPYKKVDFYITPSIYCPYMVVDISAPLLRKCKSTNYSISFCNKGTQIANNVYVEIEFDQSLTVNSASIPWSFINGNTYTFPIGDVGIFECGEFSVNVSVVCDNSVFNGKVICTDAHIYPDSICLPTSSTWNGSELQARAECIGTDSVEFSLKNIGVGNTGNLTSIAIVDVILSLDTNVNLDSGNEIKWKVSTNGISSHRIIAQQPSNHPYKTYTSAVIAGCDLVLASNYLVKQSTSFLAYPNDDEAKFIAIDCQEIVALYSGYEKSVSPIGVGVDHFITKNTDLEYKIRFQNTNTDTVYQVVIEDSISKLLDISTLQLGTSSHPYQFEIFNTGIFKFTFSNIELPSSSVNEEASHGFIQYKIKQNKNNQVGDLIANYSNVYFDYKIPFNSNIAISEIGGIFLDTIINTFPSNIGINEIEYFEICTYPNPATDFIIFDLQKKLKSISIELFDSKGQIQQKIICSNSSKIKLKRANLSKGIYVFKIYTEGIEIANGKLFFK